ncbi:MAG: pseudouridine synthase, partial [Methylotenera sp.]|nr:pseudouridine synthase [Methylotenera sp.]
MTTIKLNKKPDDTRVKTSKAPVRRTEVAKRDRSVAPPKAVVPTRVEPQPVRQEPASRAPSNQSPATAGQRNHRFDGKSHQSTSADAAPNERRPYEARQSDNSHEPRQARPAGADTRTTPRPDKNEPQYRQAPRRGGKVRDGYDAVATPQYGAAAKAAYKSTAISTDLPRLSKVMAERGICSRREADEWIMNSWVMVDGVIID